jgi:hypothetical protein
MPQRKYRGPLRIHVHYSSDLAVQEFVDEQMRDIESPYLNPEFTLLPRQLFNAARARYGDMRCWNLRIPVH